MKGLKYIGDITTNSVTGVQCSAITKREQLFLHLHGILVIEVLGLVLCSAVRNIGS